MSHSSAAAAPSGSDRPVNIPAWSAAIPKAGTGEPDRQRPGEPEPQGDGPGDPRGGNEQRREHGADFEADDAPPRAPRTAIRDDA
jgi:hypothetical protein